MKPMFPILFALSAAAAVLPSEAAAQCLPGSVFCAGVSIGSSHVSACDGAHCASISFGGSYFAPTLLPARRAQVIYVQPAPPPQVIYVQPAPPPPPIYVQPAPPPPPIYVQPAPQPPVLVVQPAPQPQPVVVQQQPVLVQPVAPPAPRRLGWGLHGHVGALAIGEGANMAGASLALRIRRPNGRFALDLGIGAYGGTDYQGNDRVEVPLTANVLGYLNPEDQLQLYGLAGLGLSFANTENFATGQVRDFTYFGGQVGVGLELRLSPTFSLNTDVRVFVRQRVDSNDPAPEFIDPDGRETNTSGGGMATLGATLYF